MTERIKATLPLAIAIGVLAFAWTEFSLNFTFHWFTAGDLGNGLALPNNFHLILPAAFVSWGFFFAAGADNASAGQGGRRLHHRWARGARNDGAVVADGRLPGLLGDRSLGRCLRSRARRAQRDGRLALRTSDVRGVRRGVLLVDRHRSRLLARERRRRRQQLGGSRRSGHRRYRGLRWCPVDALRMGVVQHHGHLALRLCPRDRVRQIGRPHRTTVQVRSHGRRAGRRGRARQRRRPGVTG